MGFGRHRETTDVGPEPCPGRPVVPAWLAVGVLTLSGLLGLVSCANAGSEPAYGDAGTPGPTASATPGVPTSSADDGEVRLEPGAPLTLPFPRLGIWWPDTRRQDHSRIARYDYVILDEGDRDALPGLRMRNPDLIALTSTNACELSYDGDGDGDPAVREVPGEWFLTQVGSTLAKGVDARATTLRVEAVTAVPGKGACGAGKTLRLFVPGDEVLIGDEVVRVRAVDAGGRTLTVERGFIRPAAAHVAGERLAALISFWPGTWLLDLSSTCPRVTVDPAAGPETWGEYNARAGAELVADPAWDGILVDRSDGDESWLVGDSTARSIDPDRSNRVPTDGYSGFDAAWNEGLRAYEQRLRELVGDDRLIYVNWGHPNYELLNGDNFEGFPAADGTAYGTSWYATVFGPRPDGGYLDWLRSARQPNLTTIQTYEDDGFPDPAGDGGYRNPATREGFRPDYRKMRFGLCTALLGDGFFSYEINTNGHAALALLWFDEYDDAGREPGYLGRPLGRARRAVGLPTTRVLSRGGRFDTAADRRRWDLWTDTSAGYAARSRLDSGVRKRGRASLRVTVSRAAGADWRVSLGQRVAVRKGYDYTLSFWARADGERELSAIVEQSRAPWRTRVELGSVRLSTGWKRYVLCAPSRARDTTAELLLQLGQSEGTVWLDDVRFQAGNTQIWRRDFEGGVAIVNAGSRARVVPLRGTFRHIRGRQAPGVNDGTRVRTVRLRPRDGVILLRP